MNTPIRRAVGRALAAGVALVLTVSGIALAKDNAVARLAQPLARDAAAGTLLHVTWRVEIPDTNGAAPFNASGMFIRLTGPSGAVVESAAGAASRPWLGEYAADVTVPAGGIATVSLGLAGLASYADGHSERSNLLFTIAGDALSPSGAAAATSVSGGAAGAGAAQRPVTPPATGPTGAPIDPLANGAALLIVIVAGSVLLAGLAWAVRRPHPTAA